MLLAKNSNFKCVKLWASKKRTGVFLRLDQQYLVAYKYGAQITQNRLYKFNVRMVTQPPADQTENSGRAYKYVESIERIKEMKKLLKIKFCRDFSETFDK